MYPPQRLPACPVTSRFSRSTEDPTLRRLPPICLFTALLLVVLSTVPARASWMVPGTPWRPKDFTLLKHDGLYHLFYIRHNRTLPMSQTENDLGHAVSPDLWNWTQAPPVLPARENGWDRTQIWAPSIVEKDGVFFMFYTGVSTIPDTCSGWQRIGVATSTDLMEWNRMDAPVLSCPMIPWTVCDSTSALTAFRDPFVMPDPAQPGHWLMYYSTFPSSDSLGMVVGVAESDGDLTQWSDRGPLWITNRSYTYSDLIESPHLFKHDSLWYLFYTTNAGTPLSFATGPDPVGSPESWTYRGRLGTMLGEDTQAWYASEHFSEGLVDYFAYVIADRINVRRIQWGADWQFSLVQPDLMHVKALSWDSTGTTEDSTATFSVVAVNWQVAPVHLEALRVRGDGSQVPVSLDSLGLPATLTLTGDTTRVAWKVKWLPDPSDTSQTMHVLLRLVDQTAAAQPLIVVRRPLLEVTGMTWDGASLAAGDTATLSIAALNWEGRSAMLEALRLRSDGSQRPVSLESLGLPAAVPLTGDTTRVRWGTSWLPDEPDTSRLMRLVVRIADSSATAAPLDVLGPPRPLQVTEMAWDGANVAEGDTATLAIAAYNWAERSVSLEAFRVHGDETRSAVPLDSLGLPATIALTGDTTRVRWGTRWLPDEPDTSRFLRLVVRLADSSAAAAPLVVVGSPRPLQVTAMSWDSASVADGDTATLEIVALNWAGRSPGLEALGSYGDTSWVPLPLDSLGLPATIALTADTTRVRWSAKWLPDVPDTSRFLRLVVRLPEQGAAAPALVVVGPPRPLRVTATTWDGASVAEGDTATLAIAAYNWAGHAVNLQALRVRSDDSQVLLAPDSLGLPASVALTGDTTRVRWSARWLADEPDTSRLLRLLVRLADSSAAATPLVVVGPPPVQVTAMVWEGERVAEGDTATLAIVALDWARRSVRLEALRLRADDSQVPMLPGSLGLPTTVALTGDTTRVRWSARWLADEPDTSRLLRLLMRLADSSAAATPLVVVGPPPVQVRAIGWDRARVAQGDTATLAIVALDWARRSVRLEALRSRGGSSLVAVPLDSLGLPATVVLTGDTTRMSWKAKWLVDEPDTSRLLQLVVRLRDQGEAAPPLAVVGPLRPLQVTAMAWDRAGVAEGDTATLAVVAVNWAEYEVALEALRVRGDSSLVLMPLDSLGLPATLPLTGDTTRVRWSAKWLADVPDTSQSLRLVMGLAARGVRAPTLIVTGPPPLEVTAMAWDGASVAKGDTATLAIVALNWPRRSVRLEALRVRGDNSQVPLTLASLGLPVTVPLMGDTTRVSWKATWLPDTPDTSRLLGLLVRLEDWTAVAPVLVVVAPPIPPESLLDVPEKAPHALGLEGAFPTPARGLLSVAFSLPGSEPATLELMDIAGRRVCSREVGALGPGRHVAVLDDVRTLAGGIYFIRLSQGGRQVVARAVVLH